MGWLDVATARARRFEEIEALIQAPEVMRDQARMTALLRERRALEDTREAFRRYEACRRVIADAQELIDGDDTELRELAVEERERAQETLATLEQALKEALVSQDEDGARNTILEIRAGTGGEEAALFARDLFRMYARFAESRRWKMEIVESHESDLGGLRSIVCAISGPDVFGTLKYESGGHRVQRVPETEAQGRIHTSLCTVAVLPEAEPVEVDMRPDDLEITVQCASGPGGQKVNKTSSAVRIVHVPTGLMVYCQEESSQHKNKDKAMRVLRSRLFEKQQREAHEQRSAKRRALIGSGDRSERVRTYNFPQNRCTDHRLEGEDKDFSLLTVMEGRLEPLLGALRDAEKLQRLQQLV